VAYVREYVDPQSVRRRLWRFLARRASALIAVSSALATDLEPYAPGRVRLVRDGVPFPDSPHRSAWPPADALFSFYGGFDENKGGELFVRAAARLHARRPGTHFRYYGVPWPGQGEYAHRIESLVSESALSDGAFSFERTRDFGDSFGEASAVVMPSRLEGFGLAALDSLAHGVPVIASRTGGLGDIVDDRVTGLLVPPGNIDALVSAMESLADDPAAVEAMGARGRRMVQSEFAVEPAVNGLIEVMHLAAGATG
jgi:mannosyltransferase